MARTTSGTETRVDVSPESREAAAALADAVRAAVRDVAPDGEPAAFGSALQRLAESAAA